MTLVKKKKSIVGRLLIYYSISKESNDALETFQVPFTYQGHKIARFPYEMQLKLT